MMYGDRILYPAKHHSNEIDSNKDIFRQTMPQKTIPDLLRSYLGMYSIKNESEQPRRKTGPRKQWIPPKTFV